MPRILVVDDDIDVRTVLADLLTFQGHEVTPAAHGAEALTLLQAATVLPDVIVLDITMPVMDGDEFLRRRGEIPRLATIPVIIVSATVGRAEPATAGVDLLPKPVDLDALSRLIELRSSADPSRRMR